MANNSNTIFRNSSLKDSDELKNFYSVKNSETLTRLKKKNANEINFTDDSSPISRFLSCHISSGSEKIRYHPKHIDSLKYTENIQSISDDKIREYFSYKPSIRTKKREEYTSYIKSTEDVFKVLELGNGKEFFDAYDGAIDLLAECEEEVLTKAVDVAKKRYISETTDEVAKSWEKNWDILIQGLTCALKIDVIQKITLILSLYLSPYKLSRLIKLTLVDAIVDLEIDKDWAISSLQPFTSKMRESDDFIRQYAQEVIESLS